MFFKKVSNFVDTLKKNIDIKVENIVKNEEINFLVSNTNFVTALEGEKFGFVALKGEIDPLEKLINEILILKPTLIIADGDCNYRRIPSNKNFIVINNLRSYLDKILKCFYDIEKSLKSKILNIAGVTGTNGKTTITLLLYNIFLRLSKENSDFSPSLIGTIKYSYNGRDLFASSISNVLLTTPDIVTNYYLLNLFLSKGVKNVFMEISSHSLEQERVKGVDFFVTAFTNLSRDHLDYHKTMKNYFNAKKKLFFEYNSEFKVINTYNIYGKTLYNELLEKKVKNVLNFVIKKPKMFFNQEFYSSFILSFYDPIRKQNIEEYIETDLIGKYNFENLSIVYIIAYLVINYGLKGSAKDLQKFKEFLRNASSFLEGAGRMELVSSYPFVFVDYAHTPDALKNALTVLRNLSKSLRDSRLIVVFGAGGNRDKTKRPKMGKIASQLADIIIITSDNPRTEDPLSIIEDIKKGVEVGFENLIIEPDRAKAIQTALLVSKPNDIILIAGKGHENYQIIGNQRLPFNDKETVINFLKNLISENLHFESNKIMFSYQHSF